MSSTLFLGCSHTLGYAEKNGEYTYWNENCYPQIYANEYNKKVVIYASPGVGNYSYPNWIKTITERHKINAVVVQSTYWNRFAMYCNKNLDYGLENFNVDNFVNDEWHQDENIKRYSDFFYKNDILQMNTNGSNPPYFRGLTVKDPNHLYYEIEWLFEQPYKYVKIWHELQTHNQYLDYIKNFLVIDKICADKKIPCYVWRINDRMDMPERTDLYGDLTNVKFEHESAQSYIKRKYNYDIDDERIDNDHYNEKVHSAIATDFLIEKFNL